MVQCDEESTSQEESIIIIKQNIQLRDWFFVNATGCHNSCYASIYCYEICV